LQRRRLRLSVAFDSPSRWHKAAQKDIEHASATNDREWYSRGNMRVDRLLYRSILRPLATQRGLCAVLVLGCALGVLGSYLAVPPVKTDSPIRIPETSLDFGTRWMQDSIEIALPVHNVAGRILDITNIATSCACTVVDRPSLTLGPRETQNLKVKLDVGRKRAQTLSRGESDFEASITMSVANWTPSAWRWRIHGKIASPITISPPQPALHVIAGAKLEPLSWKVVAAPQVRSLRLASATGVADARLDPVDPPHGYRLSAKPLKRTAIGRFVSKIVLQATGGGTMSFPPTTVEIEGRVDPPVRFEPPVALIGALEVGRSGTKEMSLVSVIGTPFTLADVKAAGNAGASVQWDVHQKGPVHAIRVSQKSTAVGVHTTVLKATVRMAQADLAPFEIQLPIVYDGTQVASTSDSTDRSVP
jgi:hypothetical protein